MLPSPPRLNSITSTTLKGVDPSNPHTLKWNKTLPPVNGKKTEEFRVIF